MKATRGQNVDCLYVKPTRSQNSRFSLQENHSRSNSRLLIGPSHEKAQTNNPFRLDYKTTFANGCHNNYQPVFICLSSRVNSLEKSEEETIWGYYQFLCFGDNDEDSRRSTEDLVMRM